MQSTKDKQRSTNERNSNTYRYERVTKFSSIQHYNDCIINQVSNERGYQVLSSRNQYNLLSWWRCFDSTKRRWPRNSGTLNKSDWKKVQHCIIAKGTQMYAHIQRLLRFNVEIIGRVIGRHGDIAEEVSEQVTKANK